LIPEGKHTIEFRFAPETYNLTERIAWTGYILLLAIVVLAIILGVVRKNKINKLK
jgi:hypothetical protein